MTLPSNRKWLSITLLAIIVPVGLLTTFKITGIIREPLAPEIVNVEAVFGNVTRPESYTFIDRVVENHYDNGFSRVKMYAHVIDYEEKHPTFGEHIWLSITATAQLQEGFIYSMLLKLSVHDADSCLVIVLLFPWGAPLTENLKTERTDTTGTQTNEAYVYATGIDEPKNCFIRIIVTWQFLDRRILDHWMTATLETTYFNGTAYQKVIIPVKIGVLV
ncbi:MAG: hypothetical protein OEY22_04405 [Candidatus Bathyarchaeota archaeon]|nr:hypothetical protein [Candidatus Bathyarchaeota archaeon]MDH5787151.1 hypothetical protein [Candidatus Bathyarchaeota archaeon]